MLRAEQTITDISSCYYYASTRKVAQAAQLTGRSEDAGKYNALADDIKEAILNEYFSPSGRLCIDTQTAYMVALKFGLYRDKDRLIDGLKARFVKDAHKIKGGFVGATMMCRVLAENGLADEAWHMLFNHEFPGWLHCVDLGATTIWERWNSLLDDGSISGTGMNSLNHYSYGSVLEFIYRNIAGIAPVAPGFASVTFAPQINWRMKYINASYVSASGTGVSNWKINGDGTVSIHMEVPFNCTAKVILPDYDGNEMELEAGSFDLTYMPKKDFRLMFTADSRLAEFAASKEAWPYWKKNCLWQWLPLRRAMWKIQISHWRRWHPCRFLGYPKRLWTRPSRQLARLKAFNSAELKLTYGTFHVTRHTPAVTCQVNASHGRVSRDKVYPCGHAQS